MASSAITLGVQIWLDTYVKSVNDIGSQDIVQVASTCLSEVTYDLATKTLGVTFKESGASYNYYGVPEKVYEDLVFAGSIGQNYNFEVKGSYFYTKV